VLAGKSHQTALRILGTLGFHAQRELHIPGNIVLLRATSEDRLDLVENTLRPPP
jgi:hypothetical protein